MHQVRDYFLEKLANGEEMTAEQMDQILSGHGDIAPATDTATVEPNTTGQPSDDGAKSGSEPAPADATGEGGEPPGEKPVILAKDGRHVIEYEKLTEAREEAKVAKEQSRTLQEQLAVVQAERDALSEKMAAAAEQDAKTGTTEATDKVVSSIQDEFPELYDAIKLETKSATSALLSRLEEIEQQLKTVLEPIIEQRQASDADEHISKLRAGVDGYDEIVAQSKKVYEWIDNQPPALRSAYAEIVDKGSADDVIGVLQSFVRDTGFTPANKQGEDEATTAAADAAASKGKSVDEAIAAAKSGTPPKSLSDIPAGSAAHHDEVAAMREMSPQALEKKFEGKTPEQILEIVSRGI